LYRLTSLPISAFARRLVTPKWGQRLACWLRPWLPENVLQQHDTGTEGVAIVLYDVGQLADQRFGLLVCQLKVHTPDHGGVNRQLITDRLSDSERAALMSDTLQRVYNWPWPA
jgi:hypothetical protein